MDDVATLVGLITEKSFYGWLPANADVVVDAVERRFPDLQTLHDELLLEVRARLAVQESLVIFGQVEFLN